MEYPYWWQLYSCRHLLALMLWHLWDGAIYGNYVHLLQFWRVGMILSEFEWVSGFWNCFPGGLPIQWNMPVQEKHASSQVSSNKRNGISEAAGVLLEEEHWRLNTMTKEQRKCKKWGAGPVYQVKNSHWNSADSLKDHRTFLDTLQVVNWFLGYSSDFTLIEMDLTPDPKNGGVLLAHFLFSGTLWLVPVSSHARCTLRPMPTHGKFLFSWRGLLLAHTSLPIQSVSLPCSS